MMSGFERSQRPDKRPELLDFVKNDGSTWELSSAETQADVTKEYTPEQQAGMLEKCREELNKFVSTEPGLGLLSRGIRETGLFKRYLEEDTNRLRHVEAMAKIEDIRGKFLQQATLIVPRQRRHQIGEALAEIVDVFLQERGIPTQSFFNEEIEVARERR